MKNAVISDIHLEFSQMKDTIPQVDNLFLPGDVFVANYLNPSRTDKDASKHCNVVKDFFHKCLDSAKFIFIVPGNHEFYHGHISTIEQNLAQWLINLVPELDGVLFVLDGNQIFDLNGKWSLAGCTLWSDMNKEDPLSMDAIRSTLNDYKCIYTDEKRKVPIRPINVLAMHKVFLSQLADRYKEAEERDRDMVIMTHHAPTFKSIDPKYKNDSLINGAYASDLSDFILDRPRIKYWLHGHIHAINDYMVGDCRVISNPRGYVMESKYDYGERNRDFKSEFSFSL